MKRLISSMMVLIMIMSAVPVLAAGEKTFTYGEDTISGTTLTDFTDGKVEGVASGSGTMTINDGVLTMACNSGAYVESYSFYGGGNIASPEVEKAVYVGITLKNLSDADIIFAFQGVRQGGKNFRMSREGDDLLLVNARGQVAKAKAVVSNNRIGAILPAGFSGMLLLPTSRVASAIDAPNDWATGGNKAFYRLGFYIKDNGSTGQGKVEVSDMFVIDQTLPEVTFMEDLNNNIENPDYSYTDAQRIQGYWTENVMYNETVCMLQDGDNISARTLFVPTRIISVVDNALNNEYKEGVDFTWVQGTNEIKWLKGSSIPYFYEGALDGLVAEGSTDYVKNWDGSFDETGRCRMGGVLYCVGPFVYKKQIAVTYEYDIKQAENVAVTEYQGSKMPITTGKIANKEEVRILFYGTSSFQGADASGFHGRAPYMPIMSDLLEGYFADNDIPAKVTNLGVGGWTTGAGLGALKGQAQYTVGSKTYNINGTNSKPLGDSYQKIAEAGEYDLVLFGFFGGNCYGTGIYADQFGKDIQGMMDIFRAGNPNCEFMFVSGIETNPLNNGYLGDYKEALQNIAGEKHAMVDTYKVHKDILKTKDYIATSGNNVNHGNDWLIRVMTQNILSAMVNGYNGFDPITQTSDTSTAAACAGTILGATALGGAAMFKRKKRGSL